jgi:hypothetical protein
VSNVSYDATRRSDLPAAYASRMPTPGLVALAPALVALALLAGCGSSTSSSTTAPRPATEAATTTSPGPSAATTKSSPATATPAPAAAQPIGFEGIPLEAGPPLAPAGTTGTTPVNGISCQPSEQLAYHIHAHLAVFVRGAPRALPGGIGIPGSTVVLTSEGPVAEGGSCIFWLHTHAPDGVIHIESPTPRIYTLGDFFAEWHQPLSRAAVAGAVGPVTAFVDGRRWPGDPRRIPLQPHAVVQLDVGTPAVAFQPLSWGENQL